MTFEAIKKEYRNQYSEQRGKNFKRLREMARLTNAELSRAIGITTKEVSVLENGTKTPSLSVILAYRKYFTEHLNVHISTDYLLGFTSAAENHSAKFSKKYGLSGEALEALAWMNEKPEEKEVDKNRKRPDRHATLHNRENISALNLILEDAYNAIQESDGNKIRTILGEIFAYIHSDNAYVDSDSKVITLKFKAGNGTGGKAAPIIESVSALYEAATRNRILRQLEGLKDRISGTDKQIINKSTKKTNRTPKK